eukprot:3937891-Rhodomonas_salina.4
MPTVANVPFHGKTVRLLDGRWLVAHDYVGATCVPTNSQVLPKNITQRLKMSAMSLFRNKIRVAGQNKKSWVFDVYDYEDIENLFSQRVPFYRQHAQAHRKIMEAIAAAHSASDECDTPDNDVPDSAAHEAFHDAPPPPPVTPPQPPLHAPAQLTEPMAQAAVEDTAAQSRRADVRERLTANISNLLNTYVAVQGNPAIPADAKQLFQRNILSILENAKRSLVDAPGPTLDRRAWGRRLMDSLGHPNYLAHALTQGLSLALRLLTNFPP